MRIQVRPSDPLILDRWIDVAYFIQWLIYGFWGIASVILGLGTVEDLASQWYQYAWSGTIGALSSIAGIMVLLAFFSMSWIRQITKKRVEFCTVIVLSVFILVYPVLLTIRALEGEQALIGATAVLAYGYLIFPILRLHILRKKIRLLKSVTPVAP